MWNIYDEVCVSVCASVYQCVCVCVCVCVCLYSVSKWQNVGISGESGVIIVVREQIT